MLGLAALIGCGTADNPYSKIENPPLVAARLLNVTLVSDSRAVVDAVTGAGWQAARLPPNYPRADAVQASMWGVPEQVATAATHYKATAKGVPDLRILEMPLAAKGRVAEQGTNQAFFRNVLGSDVPAWPLAGAQPENVRVLVWTYLVPSILDASKRLRENGIPVIYDPVGLTTPYLGQHKTLAIRAPDGTVIQLVETSSQ